MSDGLVAVVMVVVCSSRTGRPKLSGEKSSARFCDGRERLPPCPSHFDIQSLSADTVPTSLRWTGHNHE